MLREFPSALPMQVRAAPIGAVDGETRTVNVVFTTGASVRRRRWSGWDTVIPFDEVLEVSRSAVNLDRLNAGAPALDSHSSWSSSSQVGVIERAWIEGSEGKATIRFPEKGTDAAADRMFALVSQGIIRNVSVGYVIDQARVVEAEKKGEVEKRIIERWTPMEISFVTIPADAGAQVRSSEVAATFPIVFNRAAAPSTQESAMDPEELAALEAARNANTETQRAAPPASAVATVAAPDASALIAAERTRVADISAIGRQAGMATADVEGAVRDGTDVAAFRVRAFEHLAHRSNASRIETVHGGLDETDTRRRGIEAAMTHIMAGGVGELAEVGRSFMRMDTVFEFAAELIGHRFSRGFPTTQEREEVLRRAFMSTSDFPLIFENALNKALQARYALAKPVYQQLARRRTYQDFRDHKSVRAGDFPMLQPVGEAGEIKDGKFTEASEKTNVLPYAVKFALTRQMLVNDRLNAIAQVLGSYGDTVTAFEETTFFTMFTSGTSNNGPTLTEINAQVYNATTGTLAAAAAAISNQSLGLGRAAFRKQKRQDGQPIQIAPTLLLVSPDKETEAQGVLSPLYAAQAANVAIFQNLLTLAVSARLSGNAWYLFADPSVLPCFEFGLLDGYTAPRMRMDTPFGVQGVGVSLEHDFGCGAIDYRGTFKNAGA